MPSSHKPSFIFFGTGHFAEQILKTLVEQNNAPTYIVTAVDKPVGRHQVMTPSAVKVIADTHSIPTYQPSSLKNEETLSSLKEIIEKVDVCVVADYGKILPQTLLDLSQKGFLNIHPSLLPLYRGPSPLQATILNNDSHTGISIIKIDALMDHGPLVAVQKETIPEDMWPCSVQELSVYLAEKSAFLLIKTLPLYIKNETEPKDQDHSKATYTKMIDKKDAEVAFSDIEQNNLHDIYLKYCAYKEWPEVFFIHQGKRIKIKHMSFINNLYTIDKVIPEGKKEISWIEYKKHHLLQ